MTVIITSKELDEVETELAQRTTKLLWILFEHFQGAAKTQAELEGQEEVILSIVNKYNKTNPIIPSWRSLP